MSASVLEVRGLSTSFTTDVGVFRAIDDVSLEVLPGRTLAIVGESGCGKSVTALTLMGLLPTTAERTSGTMTLTTSRGAIELASLRDSELSKVRGRDMAMVFQDPMSALNPLYTVGAQIAEGILAHEGISRRDALERAVELLAKVGVPAARERVHAYPHELSGGMRQRVLIAMAIACGPTLLIADEPTTALDVTIQAQVLDLLQRLRDERGMGMILITHDLGVVAQYADDVCVMYAGRVVESGRVADVLQAPRHPYTAGLLRSIPSRVFEGGVESDLVKREALRLPTIAGTVPSLSAWPSGCRFRARCDRALPVCESESPALLGTAQKVACHAPLEAL